MAVRNFVPTFGGIDARQEGRINLVFGLVAALSGIAAILIYIDNRRHSQIQEEILALDRELKQQQLEKLRNGK
jgi:hypothetical protein